MKHQATSPPPSAAKRTVDDVDRPGARAREAKRLVFLYRPSALVRDFRTERTSERACLTPFKKWGFAIAQPV